MEEVTIYAGIEVKKTGFQASFWSPVHITPELTNFRFVTEHNSSRGISGLSRNVIVYE